MIRLTSMMLAHIATNERNKHINVENTVISATFINVCCITRHGVVAITPEQANSGHSQELETVHASNNINKNETEKCYTQIRIFTH